MQDAESIFEYLSDEDVMKYYGLAPFKTIKDAEEEIAWYEKTFADKSGIRWGITLKGMDQVIGSCGFHSCSERHSRAEVGAELSKEYWKTGIVSEAFHAILSYGFTHMNFNRINGLIEPDNIASQKLAEKSGFVREGLLRQYECTNGKFDDLYMYGLLKEDYLK